MSNHLKEATGLLLVCMLLVAPACAKKRTAERGDSTTKGTTAETTTMDTTRTTHNNRNRQERMSNESKTATSSMASQDLSLETATFASNVQDLTPVNPSTTYPGTVGTIYFFTKVLGAHDPTTIYHNWYHNDEKVATVPLKVKSASWRTYSSKLIEPTETGTWVVEVTTENGTTLTKKTVTIETSAATTTTTAN